MSPSKPLLNDESSNKWVHVNSSCCVWEETVWTQTEPELNLVPGESLGPGQGLGDDQRRSRLTPVTLRLHPLKETRQSSPKILFFAHKAFLPWERINSFFFLISRERYLYSSLCHVYTSPHSLRKRPDVRHNHHRLWPPTRREQQIGKRRL